MLDVGKPGLKPGQEKDLKDAQQLEQLCALIQSHSSETIDNRVTLYYLLSGLCTTYILRAAPPLFLHHCFFTLDGSGLWGKWKTLKQKPKYGNGNTEVRRKAAYRWPG